MFIKIVKKDLLNVSNRYIDSYKSISNIEYTNARANFSKLFLFKFFQNFKSSLELINPEIEDTIINELSYNINKIHWWKYYTNVQDKLNWEIRKTYFPPIYNLIHYEIVIEKIFLLINYIFEKNTQFKLINDKFFWYSNQYEFDKNKNINKKHYVDLWNIFKSSHKNLNKNKPNLRFIIKTDLKDFYDSINHSSFLEELKIFVNNNIFFDDLNDESKFLNEIFWFIWDKNNDFEKTFEKFLYEVSNSLLKVNNYSNLWIPQNIIWSDYISSLYIFMKIYNNAEELFLTDLKDDNGNIFFYKKENNNELYINNYSDDFAIVTNDFIFWKNFLNNYLFNLFSKDWIKFNLLKTKIYNFDDYFLEDINNLLDFNKLFLQDEWEIRKYKYYLFEGIKSQNIDKCKTIIKLSYLLNIDNYLNNEILEEIYKIIYLDLRKFGKSKENNEKNIEFFLNLIRLSPKFSIQLFELISKNSKKEKFLQTYYKFIDNFFSFLSPNTLWIILLKLNYHKTHAWGSLFKSKIIHSINTQNDDNFYFRDLLEIWSYYSSQSRILKTYPWLCNFLFNPNYEKWDVRENNIWLLLYSLFWVNHLISEKLNNKYKWVKNNEIFFINQLLSKLSFILEEMLREKEKNNLFYLMSPNFIADLHSLFNNLLSIIISLKEKEIIGCDMWKKRNIVNIEYWNKNKKPIFMKKDLWFTEDEINLLHFIKKKRAQYVHKERTWTENELSLKAYNKFENISLFQSSLSKILVTFFSLIDIYL